MKLMCKQQIGAGFIEVLVALVILAIGLLGVMSMQVQGITSNQRALFASEANLLAEDMVDRIFALGVTGAVNGEYNGVGTAANCDSVGNGLADEAVIEQDCTDWSNTITGNNISLPSPVGTVA